MILEINFSGFSIATKRVILIFFSSSFKQFTDSIKNLALKESVRGKPKSFNSYFSLLKQKTPITLLEF